jgi:hypothetical protein
VCAIVSEQLTKYLHPAPFWICSHGLIDKKR